MILDASTTVLRVAVASRSTTSFAVARAGVPLVESLALENQGEQALRDLALTLWWGADQREVPLPDLAPGERATLAGPDVPAPLPWLAEQRAPVQAEAGWLVSAAGAPLARGALAVEVRPVDEWPGDNGPLPLLACFVPSGQVGGLAAPGEPLDVVWGRLVAAELAVAPLPDLRRGARVRPVEEVLATRSANPVELAALFAACAEQVGAGVVLVVTGDRVLVGVDPELGSSGEVVTESLASLAARGAPGGALRLFDPTARGSLAAAERRAKAALDARTFAFAVDLAAARAEGWLALAAAPAPVARRPALEAWRADLAGAASAAPPRVSLPLAPRSLASLAARVSGEPGWIDLVSVGASEDRLQVPLADDERLARASALEAAAERELAEHGGGGCYLALGALRGPGGSTPIALAPVELEVHRSARKVRVRRAAEALEVNPTLADLLRRDLSVALASAASDIDALLAEVGAAVAARGWAVEPSAALVHLPPSPVAAIRDLAEHGPVWREHALLASLDGSAPPEAIAGAAEAEPSAREFPVALDADASQLAAIRAAMLGHSFVLLGAPGTGKSQTVVNLAVAAAAAGRSVLVVSARGAALHAARRRLDGVGLGSRVLPLYGHDASDRAANARWEASLDRPPSATPRPFDERAAELDVARKETSGYVRALHQRRSSGWSYYEASARLLAARDLPVVPLGLADPLALTARDLEMFEEHAARFAVVGPAVEPVSEHPFADTYPATSGPEAAEQLEQRLARVVELLDQVEERASDLAAALDLPLGTNLAAIESHADVATILGEGPFPAHAIGLDADDPSVLVPTARTFRDEARAFRTEVNKWHEHARTVLQRWHPGVYRADDLERLVQRFATWSRRPSWLAWMFLYRPRRALRTHARRGLPDNATIASDLRSALAVESGRDPLFRERKRLAAATGGEWDTEDPEHVVELAERAEDALVKFRAAQAALPLSDALLGLFHPKTPQDRRRQMKRRGADGTRAVERFRAAWRSLCDLLRPDPIGPDAPLSEYRRRVDRWREGAATFAAWSEYHLACSELSVCGLGAIVDLHRSDASRAVHAAEVPGLVERSVLKEWVAAARQADDALRAHVGADRHRAVIRFRKLDEAWCEISAAHADYALEQRRSAATGVPRDPLFAVQPRELRERWAAEAGSALFPIVLASPSAVAAHLPPAGAAGGPPFDLVIVDEASSLSAASAVGALARASQAVVCGDDQQPRPPGARSLVDDALAAGWPVHRLAWHHRSQHEDLILFSRDRLYARGPDASARFAEFGLLPAARSGPNENGLHVHRVEGVYDRNGTRTNPAEARLVVDHLVKALLQASPGDRTFGVVALDAPQADLIAALVDDARRERPEIEGHFLGVPEPVWVGDARAMVGQERDEVFVSVGFAADEAGALPSSFGALERPGGERLLHVALTRARRVARVYTGLSAAAFEERHTWSRGARELRDLLAWCERRPTPPLAVANAFQREVAAALHARGWDVAIGVGEGGYQVDVAVLYPERPGQYLLGVELDGPTYASARTARDRDRLRPKALESRGWRLLRIWSLDWALDVSRELRRLEQALDDALLGDNAPDESTEPLASVIDDEYDESPTVVRVNPEVVTYVEAEPGTVTDQGSLLHDEELLPDLKRVVQHVLDQEAPIHTLELTRRVGAAFGVSKVTVRAQRRVLAVACALERPAVLRGDFVWGSDQDPAAYDRVRGPTAQGDAARAIEHIPPEEIAHAVRQVLANDGAEAVLRSVPLADLVRETAKVFGIQRVGRRVSDGIGRGLSVLEERSEIVVQGERVVVLR